MTFLIPITEQYKCVYDDLLLYSKDSEERLTKSKDKFEIGIMYISSQDIVAKKTNRFLLSSTNIGGIEYTNLEIMAQEVLNEINDIIEQILLDIFNEVSNFSINTVRTEEINDKIVIYNLLYNESMSIVQKRIKILGSIILDNTYLSFLCISNKALPSIKSSLLQIRSIPSFVAQISAQHIPKTKNYIIKMHSGAIENKKTFVEFLRSTLTAAFKFYVNVIVTSRDYFIRTQIDKALGL